MWSIKDIMLFICSILVVIIISVKSAGANETKVSKEYIETVVGHVIRNIDNMDHKQVMSDDLNRIAHMYAIDILLTFQKQGVYIYICMLLYSNYKTQTDVSIKTLRLCTIL